MVRQTRKHWLATVIICLCIGACVTVGTVKNHRPERGLKFAHGDHKEMGCGDCHDGENGEPILPGHDICGACHDIDVDKPTPEGCGFCHADPEYTVKPRTRAIGEEIKFVHAPHAVKEIACAVCHPAPDQRPLPKGPAKPFCMDCHGKTNPALNECAVCHKELTKATIPLYHGGMRILHDVPKTWERTHGADSRRDPKFCELCHDDEAFCSSCHRKNPPQDHTLAWRRKPHGLRAAWDRERCAVCHEEDSCIKCHRHSEPASHRAGWGRVVNRHCISCHFPVEKTGCTVCHESVEHKGALPSPHTFGSFPPRCGACHPGGVPYRAPHLLNSTAHCTTCHGL